MNERRRIMLGLAAWMAAVTGLHAKLSGSWSSAINDYLSPERRKLGLASRGLSSSIDGMDKANTDGAFRTSLCDLLGITYPVLQSGMGRVAGPLLVAEVSKAGGLGILAGLNLNGETLRRQIQEVRRLTDRPFGVNLWLHHDLLPPMDTAGLPVERVEAVQDVLNRFRDRLGVPATHARPPSGPDLVHEAFDVIVEERVPVFSIGLGNPSAAMMERCRSAGIKVIAMAATVEDAVVLAGSGVDAVVAQGSEAGGHRSTFVKTASRENGSIGLMALLPQVVDAVKVPVIAAGGLADGRGLVSALALGAEGILLGTRFVATRESVALDFWKAAIVAASSDATTVTDVYTGLYARAIRNGFSNDYEAWGAPVLPGMVQAAAAQDIYVAATQRGDREHFPLMAGQSVGLVRGELPGAAEVVRSIIAEAHAVLAALPGRIRKD